jgi:PAS domain S-box-containing protein
MNSHLLLDAEGHITFLDASFETWSGYTVAELQGKRLQDNVSPKYAQQINSFLKQTQLKENLNLVRVPFFGKEGIIWVEIALTHLPPQPNGHNQTMVSIRYAQGEAHDDINEITKAHASFFAAHPFGILHLNSEGKVTNINPQIEADSGYNLDDLKRMPLTGFISAKYRWKVLREFARASCNGQASTFDIQVLIKNKQLLDVNFTIVPVVYHGETLEVYLIIKNIAERIALQKSLKKLSIVANKASDGIAILDGEFNIEFVNNGFTHMSGYTESEAIGQRMGDLLKVKNYNYEISLKVIEELTKGTFIEEEVECVKKDGSIYWNQVKLTPIMNAHGQMEMCITIHTDVTEKKKAELELRLLADDLYRQNKELQQFAYIVSHNMRSPVANIVGLANLLELFKDDPETQAQTLNELKKSVNNLDTVIKDLSYILTINNANKELLKEPVNFQDLLQKVLIDLQPQILISDADITISPKALILRTNRAYIHSIFYNLISNAIKYRSDQTPYIKIDFYPTEEHMVIYVADNGKGIDLKKHSQDLFKPYKRFDFNVEGKGLGLFLVKSHVEALGGYLNLKSELNKGSTFYIKLPYA